ncbi:MAG TPA: ParB/RepB/Spo0J family partition protein [Clostridia bacterium]|nr:ParB/RepB/Spo0J family partition protein [Clostridia bacterium]HPY97992.1 ParB/RepB/Spo0J family partition protein [Clostridia bacterium]HQC68149.1 ParB/RepB/Spo0J family partition protein [Clostridia bacterium]
MAKYGLGKGLGALLGDDYTDISVADKENRLIEMDIDKIQRDPGQPRRDFSKEEMDELAESIREKGIIQPILVRKTGDTYTIVAGERRFRAAKQEKLKTVPVIVKEFTDREVLEISLVENIQRKDLNPIEEAEAYKRLCDEFGATQEEIAKTLGKSRPVVTNKLRLLNLEEKILSFIRRGKLSEGHARLLLSVHEDIREDLAEETVNKELSVRDLEKLIKKTKRTPGKKEQIENDEEFAKVENKLQKKLATKVTITRSIKKGKITIEYYSLEGLNRIIDILSR